MSPRILDAYSGDGNMAEENRFDPARLERAERRPQVLEDAEAIRNLKARYAALCDSQYDADGIAIEHLQLHAPSLDDVFLTKTGRSLEGAEEAEAEDEEAAAEEAGVA